MSDDTRRAHVFIEGRVQGVFFRDSTRMQAERHGVAGWVRNLPDGRVEAVFEGPRDAVGALLRWAKEGPSGAYVTGVQIDDEEARGESGFAVL